MKGLGSFVSFDWARFADGKTFQVVGCGPWVDFATKAKLGTKVEIVITKDNTPYPAKDGKVISNIFERLQFKAPKDIAIPVGAIVEPVGAVATVYGDYRNKLSVRVDDVRIVGGQGGQGGK